MKRRSLLTCLLMLATWVGGDSFAEGAPLKLATLAPDGSPWHNALLEMGSEWQSKTDGRVRLRVYPGGVLGDDPDMVRKMRLGQLHAGALTVTGLAEIESSFNVFTIPLFFDSFEEYLYVRDKLTPVLRERLESRGFVMLHWGHGGWIHFFSNRPVRNVADLKQIKIFTWAGDESMTTAWKSSGFRPVALAATDILTGLQTGMIDGLPATPLAALSLQWFRQTPYMLSTPVAPLIGATVVSARKWKRLSAEDRAVVLQAARRAEERLDVEIPRKDGESVEEMKKRGLEVLSPGRADQAAWQGLADSFSARLRKGVPADIYELAIKHRDAFRKSRAEAESR